MPIIDLQRSLRRLGKIRMGEQRTAKNGKSYPAKLDTWRITSPSRDLIGHAAEIYGGTPREWSNPAGGGAEWEVVTEASTLRVVIPPHDAMFSQWYETWSAGGCQRRCDGRTEQLSGEPCICDREGSDERACAMTTRVSVLLPDVPDIGIWMLESHGYYAAVELGGVDELLRHVSGRGMVPAQLRLDQRTVKRDGETKRFVVPVLELTGVTSGQLLAGEGAAVQIDTARPVLPDAPAELDPPVEQAEGAPARRQRPVDGGVSCDGCGEPITGPAKARSGRRYHPGCLPSEPAKATKAAGKATPPAGDGELPPLPGEDGGGPSPSAPANRDPVSMRQIGAAMRAAFPVICGKGSAARGDAIRHALIAAMTSDPARHSFGDLTDRQRSALLGTLGDISNGDIAVALTSDGVHLTFSGQTRLAPWVDGCPEGIAA